MRSATPCLRVYYGDRYDEEFQVNVGSTYVEMKALLGVDFEYKDGKTWIRAMRALRKKGDLRERSPRGRGFSPMHACSVPSLDFYGFALWLFLFCSWNRDF